MAKIELHDVEQVRSPRPPAGTPWPWPEDLGAHPKTVGRLVIDQEESIATARRAGRDKVLQADLVYKPIEVPVLGGPYDGPRSGQVARYRAPAKLHGDQLEHELWEAGIGVLLGVGVHDDGHRIVELGAPGPFDADKAAQVIAAHKAGPESRPPITGGMGYIDPQSVHNPATGGIAPASWGDTVRDDLEFLVSPPQCSFEHNTTQALTTATWTSMSGNTETYDTDTMHSTVTNNSRATTFTAGKYLDLTTFEFALSGVLSYRSARFRVNGVTAYEIWTGSGTGSALRYSGARSLTLAATDYVELQLWQNTGGNLNAQLIEFVARFGTR